MVISTVIFDFDGVLLESVSIKTDAFRELFSFTPDHVNTIVQFHLDNGGMSRYDKFRHIYTNILHEDLSESRFNELSNRFSELVEHAVEKAPFVEGTEELLATISDRYSLYVVSATPQDELIRIISARGISHYFKGIFGSPEKKTTHIQNIIHRDRVLHSHVLFIGDAVNDYQAAMAAGVRFVARVTPGEPNRFMNLPDIDCQIGTMKDLKRYLEEML